MNRYKNVKDGNFPDRYIEGSFYIKDKYRVNEYNKFLPYLAYKAYDDSKLWYLLAEANDIINPFNYDKEVLLVPTEEFKDLL